MEEGKYTCAHDCEDGHGLCGSVDGGTPFLFKEAENGGDEGTCVTDTDPEDEIDDSPAPVDGVSEAPDADAGGDEVGETDEGKACDAEGEAEADPPPAWGWAFEDAADFFCYPVKVAMIINEGWAWGLVRLDEGEDWIVCCG